MARSGVPAAIRSAAVASALCMAAGALAAGPAAAQVRDRDARIPRSGELWIEAAPQFSSWREQFAAGREGIPDGRREPLYADYDGSVTDRLFPGLDPLLLVLNQDAEALGFTPLGVGGVSMGSLDFETIDVFERRVPLGLQYGIKGFAAIEIAVPIVYTEVESAFVFDSASANLVRAETALADPTTFFADLDGAQAQLQAALDGGGLSAEDSLLATQLLEGTEAFQEALDARISASEYLFTSGSVAGQQMSAYWAGFASGFQTFGISLPSFALPATARRADFDAYLERDPVRGQPLHNVTRGYTIGGVEIGLRLKLVDTFGWPTRPPPAAPADTGRVRPHGLGPVPEAEPDSLAVPEEIAVPDSLDSPEQLAVPDSLAVSDAAPAADSAGVAPLPEGEAAGQAVAAEIGQPSEAAIQSESVRPAGLRFRTTVGARYRFAASEPDRDPYLVPGVFLQQPIGDGGADLQLEVYQDVGFGPRFWMVAGATYGIQLQDELVRRVAPPDRPYAMASQEVTVQRDLGDYLRIVVSPRVALADALSLAVEYTFWKKGADAYEVVGGGLDASPLTRRTSETRHRLGVGAYYRTTRLYAAGRSGIPVDLAFLWETSIAGSGGLTPASSVATASARVPLQLF